MHLHQPASIYFFFFFFNDTATTEIYTLSLHDALPISRPRPGDRRAATLARAGRQSDRYRRLLRPSGERAPHRGGPLPLSARARDRHQGRPRATRAGPVDTERPAGVPARGL